MGETAGFAELAAYLSLLETPRVEIGCQDPLLERDGALNGVFPPLPSWSMAASPAEIVRIFAKIASRVHRFKGEGGAGDNDDAETTAAISSLSASLGYDDDSGLRVLNAALSLMCFRDAEVFPCFFILFSLWTAAGCLIVLSLNGFCCSSSCTELGLSASLIPWLACSHPPFPARLYGL